MSNFALCCWKLEDWVLMEKTCDEILEKDHGINLKAFYRKMYSNFMAQRYEFVEATVGDFLAGTKLPEEDLRELVSLRLKNGTALNSFRVKEEGMYKGMFK
jgi:hypothetical protein